MNRSALLVPLLTVVLAGPAAVAQTDVLFVGNSFTHGHEGPVMSYNSANITDANGSGYGGVPGVFKKLTDQAGLAYAVTIEAVSGQTLGYHLSNRASVIGDPKWDVVVLQENSTWPLPSANGGNPDAFIAGGDGLQDLILAANPSARVLLYETWASPTSAASNGYSGNLQAMQDDLREAYYRLHHRSARATGKPDFAGVARVGDAFLRAVDAGYADPSATDGYAAGLFYLWSTGDHRHAGKYGSYLSAVMFYAKITGRDPREIAAGAGSAAADLGISPTHAAQIHLVVHETLALPEPEPETPSPPTPTVNRLTAGVSPYNWNNSANWSAGALAASHSVLIDASSPANSIVANSTQGSPTNSVRSVSFDIGAGIKNVQGNVTVTTTRVLNLSGGLDALGGSNLLRLSADTTGTVNIGTNSGLGKLVVAPAASGSLLVENAAGTLLFGPTAELSGAVTLTKTGPGKLVLLGANTFGAGGANALDIAAGSVFANTPVAGANSATGAAEVIVRSGATLAGTGQIAPGAGHRVVIEAGGVISPGDGIGVLTLNGANTASALLIMSAGARLRMELFSAGAGSFQADRLAISNGAAGDVVTGGAVIDFSDLTAGGLPAGSYTLITAGSASVFAGLSVDGAGKIVSGLSIGSGLEAYDATLRLSGGDIGVELAPKPRTAWLGRHFNEGERRDSSVSGDLACPAGDGVPNLLKYALGLSPRVSVAANALSVETVSMNGSPRLLISHDQAIVATDIDCVVEVSADLTTWYSGDGYTSEMAAENNPDGLTRMVSTLALNSEHRFARLRVTRR